MNERGGTIVEAVAAIRAGQPVVLPTDTVYGLATTPYREEPVTRLYRLKGRDPRQPSALVASTVDVLLECVPELRGRSGTIVRALLPGPFTLVVPNPARRFRWLTGEIQEAIGVRVPELEGPGGEVLDQVGAIVATSANLPAGADPSMLAEVPLEILSSVAVALDGGILPGMPSTVIDVTGDQPVVLREGSVSGAEAMRRLGSAVRSS